MLGQGYRLTQVSGYGVGDQDFYAAIWEHMGLLFIDLTNGNVGIGTTKPREVALP
jgi:hypothetical protein